jgi:hypothetical protein
VTRQEEKPAKSTVDKPAVQETEPDKVSTRNAEPRAAPEMPAKAAKKDAFVETRTPKPEAATKRAASETVPEEEVKASKKEAAVIGLTDVVKAWRDIRSLVKPDHPSIEALLNSCKPLDVRGNELYLGFQSNKVRELFDIPERIAVARKAITEVLGLDLTIKCVITNAKGQLPPDVNPDGMVATAIQNGGEIVDVQD